MIRVMEVTEYDDHDVQTLWLALATAIQDTKPDAGLVDVLERFPAAARYTAALFPNVTVVPWRKAML